MIIKLEAMGSPWAKCSVTVEREDWVRDAGEFVVEWGLPSRGEDIPLSDDLADRLYMLQLELARLHLTSMLARL